MEIAARVDASTRFVFPAYRAEPPIDTSFLHEAPSRAFVCRVPLGFGQEVVVYAPESRPGLLLVDGICRQTEAWGYHAWRSGTMELVPVDPFVSVEVTGPPTPMPIGKRGRKVDEYSLDGQTNPWNYLPVRIAMLDGSAEGRGLLRFMRPEARTITLGRGTRVSVTCDYHGLDLGWTSDLRSWQAFHRALSTCEVAGGPDALWAWWLAARGVDPAARPLGGVKAIETRKDVAPNLERLEREEPLLWRFFGWLHDERTRDKTSNNKLLAAMLAEVGADYDALRTELRRVLDAAPDTPPIDEWRSDGDELATRSVCLSLVGASDRVAADKAKEQWQYARGARAQAEVLGVSAERHPRLMARIESGDFSLHLFHEAGQPDRLVNVEFDLWERALSRDGWADVLVPIAQNASRRTTYSKRVTSYLSFLFRLERYLDRHAPRATGGWKAIPRFVESQWDLEMDEPTEDGTTKRRSAFTPVADDEAGTVTVPYVGMSISGMQTTWCYSERYVLVEEGTEDPLFEPGAVYDSDLAEKLNGRDDYGLCFFTLTGTARNNGYPTFLVIFERTTRHGTRVHFHRVHPSRSRGPNGAPTPPSRLVAECYRYMAGNVRAEEIAHQQGDLLLVAADGPGRSADDPTGVPVFGFENHAFVPEAIDGRRVPVRLVRAQTKGRKNLLGWLYAGTGMRMPHPEHEPIEGIAPGWYALLRCKSWEANPTAVWVLSID